ncbi:MAG: tRNA uridine(34) 5-carboxymethylaminomethyl modification radical SAM/GNAT enzyme Elp3 [Nanoarchaeota archaeon]|nr:tRNA uridine(34) 5-carboxymethylaminomethyl modification radical SAM/GNAT enzyme Elp3 [Nanoarchaeota archaeon]
MAKKPVRTISGVTPLTVVLKPRKCNHGTCIYCPGGEFVPQSYTDKSPAIMRAMALKYDPFEQVKSRLDTLEKMGHPTDKIELIILGGTFLQYDLDYQYGYIKACFDALNDKKSKNLEEAKKLNEKSRHRCVAMCIENRPDNCSDEEVKRMLEFGCTRVEIGIQILDDEIYKKIKRGHTVKDVVDATKRLKDAGFKVGYHVMPGLPYSNPGKDIRLFKKIYSDDRFRPDQLKIYPCQIVDDSPLASMYKKINYEPYNEAQTREIINKIMDIIPEYCRVMRVMREIPKEKMAFDPVRIDLRKDVEQKIRDSGRKISEIRMREIGFALSRTSSKRGQGGEIGFNIDVDKNIKLKVVRYKASGGEEYFLEIVNKDNILFGLLRLRIFDEDLSKSSTSPTTASYKVNGKTQNELSVNASKNSRAKRVKHAIVRELHVYGQALALGAEGKLGQHTGLGKWLMGEAERIVLKNKIEELKVISGVGVREYYHKMGYRLEGSYMVKKF